MSIDESIRVLSNFELDVSHLFKKMYEFTVKTQNKYVPNQPIFDLKWVDLAKISLNGANRFRNIVVYILKTNMMK